MLTHGDSATSGAPVSLPGLYMENTEPLTSCACIFYRAIVLSHQGCFFMLRKPLNGLRMF